MFSLFLHEVRVPVGLSKRPINSPLFISTIVILECRVSEITRNERLAQILNCPESE